MQSAPGMRHSRREAGAVAHDPHAGGAVVVAPRDAGRRPRAVDVALVRVHRGRQEHHHVGHVGEHAAEERAEDRRAPHRAELVVAGEGVGAVAPQAHVHVAARPGLVGRHLGHERDAGAEAVGRLLQALLEHDVAVGHGQRVGVADVELVLADAPLALRALDGHARPAQVAAHRRGDVLGAGALQQVVVLEVPAGGVEVGVAAGRRVAVRRAVEVVLELGGGHRREPLPGRGVDLAPQHRPGGDGDRGVVADAGDVAQHQRRAVEPVGGAQGGEVGNQVHVAVAELPVGEVVAGDRLHLHVGGEQVVAPVRAVGRHLVEEHAGVVALAHEPAVVVGEPDDDGVDGVGRHRVAQGVEGEHPLVAARVGRGNRGHVHLRLSRRNILRCDA